MTANPKSTLGRGKSHKYFKICDEYCRRFIDTYIKFDSSSSYGFPFWHSVDIAPPGGVLPIMAYTAGLRPKRVSFLGFRYMKG